MTIPSLVGFALLPFVLLFAGMLVGDDNVWS